ncbi:MAG: hypothetical protein J1G02_06260 [Clostridiales bacterium]|nr:hypothetical protein [Clostridiales bacterium]
MLSDENKSTWNTYGRLNPSLWGVRSWGNYAEPFAFNITVNDMAEVLRHKDISLIRRESYGIQSSLSGGIRAQLKKA